MSLALDPLDARERQIAEAIAGGETCQQVAERLNLAPSTERTHLATIHRKLGVSTQLELRKHFDKKAPADLAADLQQRPDKPSIAVLAFDKMSDVPGQEYISDGCCQTDSNLSLQGQ